MSRQKLYVIFGLVCFMSVGGIVLGLAARDDAPRETERDRKVRLFDEFCRITSHMQRYDSTALVGDDPSMAKIAIRQVTYDAIYHGVSSVQLCLGSRMPDVDECGFEENPQCLAARALAFHKALGDPK